MYVVYSFIGSRRDTQSESFFLIKIGAEVEVPIISQKLCQKTELSSENNPLVKGLSKHLI